MSIPILSELKGFPKTNIPSTTITNQSSPPKIVTVKKDYERLILTGAELNTGDYVKVTETGKIWTFVEQQQSACGCNEWVLYDGPVDACGYPVTDDNGCGCPPDGGNGIKKESYDISFVNETEKAVSHTLNVSDMIVAVYDSSKNQVIFDIQIVGTTVVKLTSQTPITENFRVVLIG